MHRISTGLSMITLMVALGCLSLPRGGELHAEQATTRKPDFSSVAVDPMPVGTAKQVARMKRAKAERKA